VGTGSQAASVGEVLDDRTHKRRYWPRPFGWATFFGQGVLIEAACTYIRVTVVT